MKLVNYFFALCLMFIVFNSCQKDEVALNSDEILLSQQVTQSEETLADIDLLVDEALDLDFGLLKSASIESSIYLADCPVITKDTTSSPMIMTIDFGTSCTGKDGKIRSGKIIVTSTSFNTFPTVRTKTFDNFFDEGKKIEGSIVKTISHDQENYIRRANITENVTLTFPDQEGKATRVANMTREYQRNKLANPLDNQVASWGTVEFSGISGKNVTRTIGAQNPLIFKVRCHHIISGIVSFATSEGKNWTINYGNGECDNKATITIDGKSKEIRIR